MQSYQIHTPGCFLIIQFLEENNIYFTNVPAEGRYGKVNVLFSVIKRERLRIILSGIQTYNPNAFYTIESVKRVSDSEFPEERQKYALFTYLTGKRK